MLTPERWAEVQAAFFAALELEPDERTAHVAALAAEDPELAREVGRMLDADLSGAGFAEPPDQTAVRREMSPADYLKGRRLGDFELEEELGRGGMGVVYRATQVSLERTVAVKILPPALASAPTAYERFRREAVTASRLTHPGVAEPIHFGQDEGMAFIAMRYVAGPTLAEELKRDRAGEPAESLPRTPEEVAACLAAVLDALEHVHEKGLIHRDVKPGNLILTPEGPVLIDFGLVKDTDLDEVLEDLSRSGVAIGTPHYMSPEQVEARRHSIDRRTDIYSMGIVLFELLNGRPPFRGKRPDAICTQILENRLPKAAPEVPEALRLVTQQATARRPVDRYASAAEMAADLRRFLAGEPVAAQELPLHVRAWRTIQRHRVATAATLLLLIGALAGYAFKASDADAAIGRTFGITLMPPEVLAQEFANAEAAFDLGRVGIESVTVEAFRFTDALGEQALELTESKLGSGSPLPLEAGTWRFLLTAADGRRAELVRTLKPGASEIFEVLALGPADVSEDMVALSQTPFTPGALRQGAAPEVAFLEMMPFEDSPQVVAAFELDRHAVTHAEFRAVFEAVGLWPPPGMPSGWTATQLPHYDAPPTADWLERPATMVPQAIARSFAELRGGRLPTAAEHLLVTQILRPAWKPESALYLGVGPGPALATREYASYLEHAQPAQSGPALAPLGITHWFDNVTCLVEAALFFQPQAADGAGELVPGDGDLVPQVLSAHMGGFWAQSPAFMQASGTVQPNLFVQDEGAPEVGFRVARSL